jgi:hypothetical protein
MGARLNNFRLALLSASVFVALASAPARADYVESVSAQLQRQGYVQISVSSTLLGRARIVAESKAGYREIIMNPRTGEILRDVWLAAEATSGPLIVGSDTNISPEDDHDDDKDSDSDGDKERGRGDGTNGGGDD